MNGEYLFIWSSVTRLGMTHEYYCHIHTYGGLVVDMRTPEFTENDAILSIAVFLYTNVT